MEEINVKLGVDGKALTPELQEAANSFKKFGDDVNTTLANTAAQSAKSGVSLRKYAKSNINAGYAAQNLGRVIQDLPFGLIAIQNNIVPLVESLGASAGLALAFSLATAAATFFVQIMQKNDRETKVAAKTNENYADSLDSVRQSQVKGAQNAVTELTTLKLLYTQYTNANIPLTQRKDAYKQIQDTYPSYFSNIKFEQQATEKTTAAYKALTGSILATAQAQAALDIITKNSSDILLNNEKIRDFETKINNERLANIKKIADARSAGASASQLAIMQARMIGKEEERRAEFQKNINNLNAVNYNLTNDNLRIETDINTQISKGASLTGKVGEKIDDNTDKIQNLKDQLQKINEDMILQGIDLRADRFKDSLKQVEKFQNDSSDLLGKGATVKPVTVPINPIVDTGVLYSNADLIKEYFQYDILPAIQSSFETFFEDIITKGKLSFQSLGNAILGVFAKILASEVANSLFRFIGKLAGIAVTGGASAGAGFFGSLLKGLIPGFENGVQNFGGGLAYVHAGEVLTNLSPGTSVIPASVVSGFGGAQSQVFIATSVVRGDDIHTTYNRTDRTNSRIV